MSPVAGLTIIASTMVLHARDRELSLAGHLQRKGPPQRHQDFGGASGLITSMSNVAQQNSSQSANAPTPGSNVVEKQMRRTATAQGISITHQSSQFSVSMVHKNELSI